MFQVNAPAFPTLALWGPPPFLVAPALLLADVQHHEMPHPKQEDARSGVAPFVLLGSGLAVTGAFGVTCFGFRGVALGVAFAFSGA